MIAANINRIVEEQAVVEQADVERMNAENAKLPASVSGDH